jgi:hypothetical protein
MTTFKLESGRNIYRDGKPFIAIMRCGDTTACEPTTPPARSL